MMVMAIKAPNTIQKSQATMPPPITNHKRFPANAIGSSVPLPDYDRVKLRTSGGHAACEFSQMICEISITCTSHEKC